MHKRVTHHKGGGSFKYKLKGVILELYTSYCTQNRILCIAAVFVYTYIGCHLVAMRHMHKMIIHWSYTVYLMTHLLDVDDDASYPLSQRLSVIILFLYTRWECVSSVDIKTCKNLLSLLSRNDHLSYLDPSVPTVVSLFVFVYVYVCVAALFLLMSNLIVSATKNHDGDSLKDNWSRKTLQQ